MGRTSVTTAVGVGTNFVVAPIATSLAKSAGIHPILANDIGIAASIFTAGKVSKAGGARAEVGEVGNAELNTCDSIKKIINDRGYSVDEFAQLLDPDRVLSYSEELLVASVRKEIGLPSADTLMCKTALFQEKVQVKVR